MVHLLVVAGLLVCAGARAEGNRVEGMVVELRENPDFRVRTQAALALGATKDKRAVEPLCSGLEDSNTTVRAAAAAALGKLLLGGLECLKAQAASEANASVAAVIEKSIEKIKAAQKPAINADTRYYVAIGELTDKTGREGTGLSDHVRAAMEKAAAGLEGCVVAPASETQAQAASALKKWKKTKAFFLWPKALPPDYGGGNLTVRFEVAVFTYPGKALKGTIPLKLTLPQVTAPDASAEADLFVRAAESGFERFVSNASRFE